MRALLIWILASLAVPGWARETDPVPISIPLKGLVGDCCEAPVRDALSSIEHVASVNVRRDHGVCAADIFMEYGWGLKISKIEEALGMANCKTGGHTKTEYEVSESLGLVDVILFKTESKVDEAALEEALRKFEGLKHCWTLEDMIHVIFRGKDQPTLLEFRQGCGVEIAEAIFAPSQGGVQYYCPMHLDVGASRSGECPHCGMPLSKREVGSPD